MRRLLLAVAVAAAFALPAAAATVDPRLLVLSRFDVPKRYFFDDDNSAPLTRALLTQVSGSAATRRLLRAGFTSGYFARYLNSDPPHWRYVDSGAYVFRRPAGAQGIFPWLLSSGLAPAPSGGRRFQLGDEGRIYSSPADEGTAVVWRQGRVVAWVSCRGMTRHRALAIAQARKQQRRIVSELG